MMSDLEKVFIFVFDLLHSSLRWAAFVTYVLVIPLLMLGILKVFDIAVWLVRQY